MSPRTGRRSGFSTYLRMLSYLRPYKWRVVQVLLLSACTAFFSIASLGAMKPLFDTLFEEDVADFSIGLQARNAKGEVIEQVRIRAEMPDGWRGEKGKNWQIIEEESTVIEGFRTEKFVEIPVTLQNRGDTPVSELNLDAHMVSKGWHVEVLDPESATAQGIGAGKEITLRLKMTPVYSNQMFTGSFWQNPGPRKVADWLQAKVFPNKFKALFVISGAILLSTLLKSACMFSKNYWSNYLSKKSIVDIRAELFDVLIAQSLNYFDNRKSGAIISKFTYSLGQVQKGVTVILSVLATEPLMVVGALALAFSINLNLSLIGILIFPLNLIVILVTGKMIRRSTHRSLKQSSNMMHLLQRSIDGIRIVKAFLMEDKTRAGFSEANDEAFRYDMRGAKARSMLQPVVESFSAGFVVVFLLLGGVSVLRGEMTSGDFVVFYAAMIACYTPIKKINTAIADIQGSVVGAKEIFAELDAPPDIQEVPDAVELPPMTTALSFKNVSFEYAALAPVLIDIDLEIRKGAFVALVGPSGAGKSTLVNLIPRFYEIKKGSISIDGVDIRQASFESLRSQVGFVTQEPILFHDTVANNIALGKKDATPEQIEAAAKTAHSHDFIMELPGGYEAIIGDRGVKLSGGQRQRLALARAIVRDPAILLLDEATSSLDTESERLIQDSMDKFARGRTTLVIAHRLSTVLHADKIIVMQSGRIVEAGSHDELMKIDGLYRRLYDIQFRNDPVAQDPSATQRKPA